METLLRQYALATQHNFLIHAPLDLSYVESRIFSLALACIHKNDHELPPISMTFKQVFASEAGSNYASLAKAIDALVGKRVRLQSVTSKRTQVEVYNIISVLRLDSDTGLITGKFSPDIAPYLLALRNNFTSMEVEILLTMKSAHTMRLAWFLKAHDYQKVVEIELVKLRKLLFGEEPGYADFFEFKRRVLNPVLEELNDEAGINWQVSYEEIKKGLRQVIALRFNIPKFPGELMGKAKTSKKTKQLALPTEPAATLAPAPTPAPPVAQGVQARVVKRMEKLLLTPAQIKKVLEVVVGEQELTKLMTLLHPIQRDFEQISETAYTEKTIAGLTINKLKSTYPRLYAAWTKE